MDSRINICFVLKLFYMWGACLKKTNVLTIEPDIRNCNLMVKGTP